MRKLAVVLLVAVCATGCNKLKGDKGDKGDPGPGQILIYSGSVGGSNNFVTTIPVDPDIIGTINVFIFDGTTYTALPVYVPGQGVNCIGFFTPGATSGALQIVNAASAGGTHWQAVVITE